MLWKQKEDIDLEKVDDKILIFDPDLFDFYEMNETMSIIWSALAHPVSEEQLVSILMNEFEVNKETASSDVVEIIKDLKKKRLIVEAGK